MVTWYGTDAMQTQKQHSIGNSFLNLAAAVINRSLADLEGIAATRASNRDRDEAMSWINSHECEAYCLVLDADYRTIRERAAALYRRFLEEAESREKASGKPRKRPGHWGSLSEARPHGGSYR
jgi:hypothetical protein